jgi:hypothetical protein
MHLCNVISWLILAEVGAEQAVSYCVPRYSKLCCFGLPCEWLDVLRLTAAPVLRPCTHLQRRRLQHFRGRPCVNGAGGGGAGSVVVAALLGLWLGCGGCGRTGCLDSERVARAANAQRTGRCLPACLRGWWLAVQPACGGRVASPRVLRVVLQHNFVFRPGWSLAGAGTVERHEPAGRTGRPAWASGGWASEGE